MGPARLFVAAVLLVATSLFADTMPETLRVASVQMEVTSDIDRNAARIIKGIEDAAAAGARIVVFPETVLSGFDGETIAKLNWEQLNSAMVRIAASAAKHQVYVLYGTATKSEHEKPFNSAVLVGPDGKEVTRYHKMKPEGHFQPGDHLALFEIDGIPATVIICHDERFPEMVRLPVLAGARICFYISYEINNLPDALRKMDGYRAQLVARAAENGIWVVQSNGIGPLTGSNAVSLGHSRVVDPGGTVVAELPALKDDMLLHDITPAAARRGNALETFELEGLKDWWEEGLKKFVQP